MTHESYSLDLTHAQYKSLYREMVFVRRLDQEATALQRQGELGLWASSLGQEAAQVGSAFALEKMTLHSRPIANMVSPGCAVWTP